MRRSLLCVGWALACGCGSNDEPSAEDTSASLSSVDSPSADAPSADAPETDASADGSAFRYDETMQVIYLDTRIAPGQRRQFGLGLGSITIETLHLDEGKLTFRYIPEVEGGYTIYECTVPVSETPVEFHVDPDGSPGRTSFDLSECRVVRSGNALLDQ